MKIAYLIQNFEAGGLERMVLSLATAVSRRGDQVVVAAYLNTGPFRSEFERAGVRTVFFPEGPGLRWRFPFRLWRWLHRDRIDLLHTHHLGPYLYGVVAAKLARTPLVHTEHSRELYDTRHYRWIGRSMDHAAHVIAVSDELARWRAGAYGRTVDVIPNGVRIPPPTGPQGQRAARNALNLGMEDFVVGCVARLSSEKGHGTLLEAFKILVQRQPNARLVLVGDGPERPPIQAEIERHRLQGQVRLIGTRMDVERLLPAFDVVVLASVREGLPLALLEAMAHGIPVVATSVGGIPELLKSGGGLLIPPGDPDKLAIALTSFADKGEGWREQGQIGRKVIQKNYAVEGMVSRYVELYHQVLSGRNP